MPPGSTASPLLRSAAMAPWGPARRHGGRRTSVGPALGLLALVVAACTSAPSAAPGTRAAVPASTSTTAPLPAVAPPAPVSWSTCPGDTGVVVQCATVDVPEDYRDPAAGTLPIAVTRAPALDPAARVGALFFNPGGPGESGNQILPLAVDLLPPTVRDDFDVVSFDPRGVGASRPLDCGTSPSAVAAAVPVPAPGRPLPSAPLFTAMARACATREPVLTPLVDTTDTARDMDRIRQALGLASISYYGLSYGTVLGTVYAGLFPDRVRAMVLDGAVDLNATLAQQADQQAPALERSLDHLLASCPPATCPLGRDPRAGFATLSASLTRTPLPAPGRGDDVPVTVGDLDTATLFDLSVPSSTVSYFAALAAARSGDGAPLRQLALDFELDIDGAPLVDAQWAITCNDTADHPDAAAAGAQARSLAARYPLIGAYAVTYQLAGCVSWAPAARPLVDVHPTGTPPVLVIGNTGDPNTPLVGARHLATYYPVARQLTWQGWGHTWLLNGSTDTCVRRTVTGYLVGGTLPPAGATCR